MTWAEYKAKGIPGRLEAARADLNPTIIARMPSGWAVRLLEVMKEAGIK